MSLSPVEKTHHKKKDIPKSKLSKKKKLSQIIMLKMAAGLPLTPYEKAVWATLSTLNEED